MNDLSSMLGPGTLHIDAPGLVTLLGADIVNTNVGSLARRRLTGSLPLMAAFVVAGDEFTKEQTGYNLYNLTDGIETSELKGWFTRWLDAQQLHGSTSIFHWRDRPLSSSDVACESLSLLIASVILAPLVTFTACYGDWYGFGNALSIIISIFVRRYLVWQRCEGLKSVTATQPCRSPVLHDLEQQATARRNGCDDPVVLLITNPRGQMITMIAPRSILTTIVRPIPLPNNRLYQSIRWLGWTAFGAHLILLGMSSVIAQAYTLCMLVLSTTLYCHKLPYDQESGSTMWRAKDGSQSQVIATQFSSQLVVEHEIPDGTAYSGLEERRSLAIIRLEPTEEQERLLQHWGILPYRSSQLHKAYDGAKRIYAKQVELHKDSLSCGTRE